MDEKITQRNKFKSRKFAIKIGMDRTYFASVKLGKRNISIVNLEKIAMKLNVSLADLFSNI